MRDQEMPHDGLERFRVRRHPLGVHGGHDHRDLGYLGGVATIPAHDAADRCTDLPSVLERPDDIRAHVTLHAPASHRKDEHHVLGRQPACLQPVSEDGFPTIVVDTRRKLGDVVRGRIRLDPGNLAEIINRVRRMPGAASYAEDEQAAAS